MSKTLEDRILQLENDSLVHYILLKTIIFELMVQRPPFSKKLLGNLDLAMNGLKQGSTLETFKVARETFEESSIQALKVTRR